MSKLFKYITIVGLAASVLALSGCAEKCVIVAAGGTANHKVATKNGEIQIVDPASRIVSGNIIQAKVTLENSYSESQNVQYKFQWYSAEGFSVGENTPWLPTQISPYASQVVAAVAPTPAAVKYNILVCKMN